MGVCTEDDNFLADEIFSLMIRILNNNEWEIKPFRPDKNERDAMHNGFAFYDRVNQDEGTILVTNKVKDGLFHAMLHIIFDPESDRPDKEIEAIEDHLWPMLAAAQKEILASYVPHKNKII